MFSKKKEKRLYLESLSHFPIFVPKSWFSLKKKRFSFRIALTFPYFCPKSWFSLKKKKGFYLESLSHFPIFVPKPWCFLKKKKKERSAHGLPDRTPEKCLKNGTDGKPNCTYCFHFDLCSVAY